MHTTRPKLPLEVRPHRCRYGSVTGHRPGNLTELLSEKLGTARVGHDLPFSRRSTAGTYMRTRDIPGKAELVSGCSAIGQGYTAEIGPKEIRDGCASSKDHFLRKLSVF